MNNSDIVEVVATNNCIPVRYLKQKTFQKIFSNNKPKSLYLHIFGY